MKMILKKEKRENGYLLTSDNGYILVEFNYNFGRKEQVCFVELKDGKTKCFNRLSDAKLFLELGF